MARVSGPGKAFLQCAFAPPDFNVDPGQGIPDKYNGKSLGVKHQLTATIGANGAASTGTDYYYVVAPTPGVAYWSFSLPGGTAPTSSNVVLVPTLYPDFASLFGNPVSGGSSRSSNVEAFRYASTAVGLYPTSNFMQYGGSISIWKGPLALTTEARVTQLSATAGASTTTNTIAVNGLESLIAIGRENFTHSFIDGAYTISTCNQPEFEFKPILENTGTVPQPSANFNAAANASNMFGTFGNGTSDVFLGLGDMDSIFIKISSAGGSVNQAVIKTWSCVEYKPNQSSALYQYAGHSPPHDPLALELYRAVAAGLPTAVVCAENAKFWEMVQKLIRGVATVASYAPGAVGLAGTGLGMLMDGIATLTM